MEQIKRRNNKLSPCSFCAYHVRSGCTVTPNAYNCRQATNEFYAYLATLKKNKANRK